MSRIDEIKRLRIEEGMSLRSIAKVIGCSKSVVSYHCKGLRPNNPLYDNQARATEANAEKHRIIRESYRDEGRKKAKRTSTNGGFLAGCMLFWGEGSNDRNQVAFTNSDPDMMVIFVKFLRDYFFVSSKKIKVHVNCRDDIFSVAEIKKFWLGKFNLNDESWYKPSVNKSSSAWKSLSANKYPNGICRVSVCDTKIVQMIYGAIEYYKTVL